MPAGAEATSGWAGGSGVVGCGTRIDGSTCDAADDEMIAPAAPMAPKRNISRRFSDKSQPSR